MTGEHQETSFIRRYVDEEIRRDKWNKLARKWSISGPPASPSDDDLETYRRIIRATPSGPEPAKVILLGSTPSIRKIFHEDEFRNFTLLCVDWSTEMYSKASEAMGALNEHESYIEDNWINVRVGEGKWDLVLGDKIVDNIPMGEWPAFFENVHSHLRPGGRFGLHVAYVTEKHRGIVFSEAFRFWSSQVSKGQMSSIDAASGLWEDCLTGSAYANESTKQFLSVGKYSQEILSFGESLDPNTENSDLELYREFVSLFGPSLFDVWTAYSEENVSTAIERKFRILNVHESSDYSVADVQPILEMQKL